LWGGEARNLSPFDRSNPVLIERGVGIGHTGDNPRGLISGPIGDVDGVGCEVYELDHVASPVK
jgi:hypothetical protein